MNLSFLKSRVYVVIALIIMSYSFTFPMIAFHGVLDKISEGKADEISSFTKNVWKYYTKGRYKNASNLEENSNDLDKMIKNSEEISVASFPIWSVSLEAPNYPKKVFPSGIPVFFHLDGFSGEVHEMNVINHFIGMDSMYRGGQIEREIGVYIFLLISLVMIYFIFYSDKISNFLMIIPISLPILFVADYAYWLYWFGHNLHDWGAFTVKPFMPTLLGNGKVAQFTTHSYPDIGFYMFVLISLFSLLGVFSRRKTLKKRLDDKQ